MREVVGLRRPEGGRESPGECSLEAFNLWISSGGAFWGAEGAAAAFFFPLSFQGIQNAVHATFASVAGKL